MNQIRDDEECLALISNKCTVGSRSVPLNIFFFQRDPILLFFQLFQTSIKMPRPKTKTLEKMLKIPQKELSPLIAFI